MRALKQHYVGSMYFTLFTMIAGFVYGLYAFGTVAQATITMAIMGILGVLEVSLSFDNAVANAKILETMDDKWKHRFLTWGMLIAVFGMRIVFPVLIVAVVGNVSMIDALMMAINTPQQYAEMIESSHIAIAGFGGAFLLLVSLGFFMDEDKETHWLGVVESRVQKLGSALAVTIALITIIVFYKYVLSVVDRDTFLIAGLLGIVTHEIIARFGDAMGTEDGTTTVAKAGLAAFLYLEVLDASFSFDGVIGAFAISTNIFIIAGGLGIGAMFVRSMTLHLVEEKTLSTYKYLEHGAFWSILVLAGIMFTSTVVEIPEIVTGLLSVSLIAIAFVHSIMENKRK